VEEILYEKQRWKTFTVVGWRRSKFSEITVDRQFVALYDAGPPNLAE
jgi:hypothetical protein